MQVMNRRKMRTTPENVYFQVLFLFLPRLGVLRRHGNATFQGTTRTEQSSLLIRMFSKRQEHHKRGCWKKIKLMWFRQIRVVEHLIFPSSTRNHTNVISFEQPVY